jgi:aspartyl-tRNA(Asn)/glutamyl-tRNA(Gln) amidotransferase subunit C
MSVSPEEVRRIAALARLELAEPEVSEMSRQLSSILDHMAALGQVDATEAGPVAEVFDAPAPLREDRVGFDPLARPVNDIAPDWRDAFFVVPRLAALDADALDAEVDSA